MQVGSLVSARNGLGIGKIVALEGETAVVEYFESVAVRDRLPIPLRTLQPARLTPETRCYLCDEAGERWQAGRIGLRVAGAYEVKLPDRQGGYVSEERIYVRCARPIREPTDILVHRAHGSAFFSDRRQPFVRALVEQRAATRGLSGLFSSRVELYPHQVEVVRRVLEDPVQRYLLADEVGLGKTIEAGAILRQFLLDDPDGNALILVPPLLKEQWWGELDAKFAAFDFDDRVHLLGTDEVESYTGTQPRMVVIDEAHHVAELARAGDPELVEKWERFRALAHGADRLLLLSATPALHHEEAFLAMLHLLDPTVYRMDEVEEFRERVRKRQEMGHFLLSFNEGAPGFTLRRGLGRLRDMFPGDPRLAESTARLEAALESGDAEERDRCVRRIRTHLGETYRLHRRLLRNRREVAEAGLTAGRYREGGGSLKAEYDLDVRPERLHALLDDWRVGAHAAAAEGSEESDLLLRVFLVFFETYGTWLPLFEDVLRVRCGEPVSPALDASLSPKEIAALRDAPEFPGEADLLDAMLEILGDPSEDGDRVDLLRRMIASLIRVEPRQVPPKVVVFTSYPRVCSEIVSHLRQEWGVDRVAMYGAGISGEQAEDAVRRFREDPSCPVLVCDRSGEEGRNLQFADWLIHFDVPFSPSRVEQRIGRLDRIGRVRAVRSRVFVGPEEVEHSLLEAWFRMLDEGFGVFRRSIASLQFFVDARLPQLARALFRNGAQGLLSELEPMRAEIEQEQLRLSEQYALDEIDALESEAQDFFRQLDDFDAEHDRLQKATETWICGALHIEARRDSEIPHVVRYQPSRQSLIPHDFLLSRLGSHVGRRGTYRRTTAAQVSDVILYRVGETFIDTMAAYINWDDRGRASAVWRCESSWDPAEGAEWAGFRFHYVVEADIAAALQVLRESGLHGVDPAALRRRADALYPPHVEEILVGSEGAAVTDERLRMILARPFRKRRDYGNDFNLTKHRLPALDLVVDPAVWPDVCGGARHASEELLREGSAFHAHSQERACRAERLLEHRLDQLRLRESQSPEDGFDEIAFEQALGEAILAGIRTPSIRPDAVTFFVVSGRDPFGPERSAY